MKYAMFFVFMNFSFGLVAQNMNVHKMDSILHSITDSISGGEGVWEMELAGRHMLVITDQNNNRMCIISPIVDVRLLPEEEYKKALVANFHSALDARYAISDDILWSTFIHRFQELSTEQFLDAIRQVNNAANTFGTSYNSTELQFPSNDEQIEESTKEEKLKKKVRKT